jgi:hypothetical protein
MYERGGSPRTFYLRVAQKMLMQRCTPPRNSATLYCAAIALPATQGREPCHFVPAVKASENKADCLSAGNCRPNRVSHELGVTCDGRDQGRFSLRLAP